MLATVLMIAFNLALASHYACEAWELAAELLLLGN